MRPILLLLLSLFLNGFYTNAQNGCPGCLVQVPPGFPADTIYLPAFPDGVQGMPYNQDYSFRMPKSTTPFAAIDSTTPAGLPISKIEIISLSGLPLGLDWQPNQWTFDPNNQTDGCIKLCGKPLQTDSFILSVKVKVSVFFVTREVEFPLHLYIAPAVASNNGFSMININGCDSLYTHFLNKIPSGNHPGFSYAWNFGDNTSSTLENPPPHLYQQPGNYVVNYRAIIDTSGYILKSATVLAVECVDQLGLGNPDLYLLLRKPNGTLIYDSNPDVPNTQLPYTFPLNFKLNQGNYSIEVWDEDSGLKGGDDPCGTVFFNILSNDTITSGGFKVILNIVHPIDTIYATDTVRVFQSPATPTIHSPEGLSRCSDNQTPIILLSSAPNANQWILNGQILEGSTSTQLIAESNGFYQVLVSNANGCQAISDSAFVQIFPAPQTPLFLNKNNLLFLADTFNIPKPWSAQWFLNNQPIPGANQLRYCALTDGAYGLLITDPANGCTAFYATTVDYDPNYDCTVASTEPTNKILSIYPNPASNQFFVQAPEGLGCLNLYDNNGTRLATISQNNSFFCINTDNLPAGLYLIEYYDLQGNRSLGKIAILK